MWNEHRDYSRSKRSNNRENAIKILTDANIDHEIKNMGAHIIVHGKESIIDFWPGTGLYIIRNTQTKERGIFNMIKKHCVPSIPKKEIIIDKDDTSCPF